MNLFINMPLDISNVAPLKYGAQRRTKERRKALRNRLYDWLHPIFNSFYSFRFNIESAYVCGLL